jgi:hypothetical protein
MREKASQVKVLRLNPYVPLSPMVFVEGQDPGEVDYF